MSKKSIAFLCTTPSLLISTPSKDAAYILKIIFIFAIVIRYNEQNLCFFFLFVITDKALQLSKLIYSSQ